MAGAKLLGWILASRIIENEKLSDILSIVVQSMNWCYLVVGLARRYVPKQILFVVMHYRGDGSLAEHNPDAYVGNWNDQLTQRGWTFRGKHILELGSGRYARFALRLLASGASRVTLIDLYAVPLSAPAHRKLLLEDCARLKLNFDDVLSRITVVQGDIAGLIPPRPSQRVDMVISHSVLEHTRDPLVVLTSCLHWMLPGGLTCHIIDLRDHNLRFRYPFEMLTFSDRLWARCLDLGGGFHLNRWRAPEYLDALREAGFINVGYDVLTEDKQSLQCVLPRLHKRFRSIPLTTLAISSMSLFGHTPADSH
jgi:SAM-dependent methyltransferase